MRFETDAQYLKCWSDVLNSRLSQAVDDILNVDGVVGLVVAGSLGRREPWPLSDIDLLPVYRDSQLAEARNQVEEVRGKLLDRWQREGFRTPLDVGTLCFSLDEVENTLNRNVSAVQRMTDDRWFHSIDKGYRGYGVGATSHGVAIAQGLAQWFTNYRLCPAVHEFRVDRKRHLLQEAISSARSALGSSEAVSAGIALARAVDAAISLLMEAWRERDHSWARLATRFELAAKRRELEQLLDVVFSAGRLDLENVKRRMSTAPANVVARHKISYIARTLIGERVDELQDARDSLAVTSSYERRYRSPPFPPWVGLHTDTARMEEHASALLTALRFPQPCNVFNRMHCDR